MTTIEILEKSGIENTSILFHCILNRIPILINAENNEEICDFINNLSTLIPFRNKLSFYDDFLNNEEYESILDMEDQDIDIQRSIFVCYPYAAEELIKIKPIFKSWIIGITSTGNSSLFDRYKKVLYEKSTYFLIVNMKNKFYFEVEIEGKQFPNFDLSYEEWLFKNAINNTEISIEKVRRILSKQLKTYRIEKIDYKNLMNFNYEENVLKENIIKKEIFNFYEACRRSFSIFSRLNSLISLGIEAKISKRTFYNTIAYRSSSPERILNFIQNEWNLSFFELLNLNKASNFSDTLESLWG